MHNKTDVELAKMLWDFLDQEDVLEPADLIIGFGCNDPRVAEKCAELYLSGMAPMILFTGGRGARKTIKSIADNEAERFGKIAQHLGVSKSAILLEKNATNTGENIVLSFNKLSAKNLTPRKIILVHKPYMTRRTYAAFMKQWPQSPKPKIMITSKYESYTQYMQHDQYKNVDVISMLVGDLQRVKVYGERGWQLPQEIPARVWSASDELVKRGYDKHVIL